MKNVGPYTAIIHNGVKIINYTGDKVYPPFMDVSSTVFDKSIGDERVYKLIKEKGFYHLHQIDNGIFFAAIDYFRNIGAEWCNLPLTTLMISSPGEIYAGQKLDYTTDALPVTISWFDGDREIFLSESSQFYLELRLLLEGVDKVFSIYNSFRKEPADFSHLSEFQHIEFEGKIDFEENVTTAINVLKYITKYILENNREDLGWFLTKEDISLLEEIFEPKHFHTITLKEALRVLYNDTGDPLYKDFSLKNFGSWEEIRLTELLGGHAIMTEYPMLQIPFYHNVKKKDENDIPLGENADIILSGYREVIGSGTRIQDPKLLAEKAKIFSLPLEDYAPYFEMRKLSHYKRTSGFGLGWQRYVHWLLKLPYIMGGDSCASRTSLTKAISISMNPKDFKSFFELYAENVDHANDLAFWRLSDEIILQIIKQHLPNTLTANNIIFDAGGGTARWAQILCREFKSKVIVYDLSEDMLTQAQKNIQIAGLEDRVSLKRGDLINISDIASSSVDHIVSIYNPISFISEIGQAFNELYRILKKEGVIIIMGQGFYNAIASKINNYSASKDELATLEVSYNVKWDLHVPPLNVFSKESLENSLSLAGFTIVKTYGVPVFVRPGPEDFNPSNKIKSAISKKLENQEYFRFVFETEVKYNSLPDVVDRGMNIFSVAIKK